MLAVLLPQQLMAAGFNNETLHYEIVYHWGMIWKHAGDATLSLRKTSNGYNAQLTGKTRPGPTRFTPSVTHSSAP